MKKNLICLVLLLLVTALLLGCESEDRRPGGMTGMIIDGQNGNLVEGVQVRIEPRTTPVFTNTDGVYAMPDIPPGSYRLIASKQGFQDFYRQIRISPAMTSTNDIILQPLLIIVPTEVK